ncbi:MAG: class I SAM-dependent methyltransferase [Saprospiraceae bacterium]|nr:class I SAM-dependent methyltransferase [Saprospiraceae bacterium]HRG69590.1 class I SAM-dependent methyltransferase [Saprospiraceae bacterium]
MVKILRRILNFARRNGYGLLVDKIIYYYYNIKYSQNNEEFIKLNPTIPLPPSYMLFESYKLNYRDYYIYGRETAEWILNLISNHIDLNKQIKILDWGCGPSRVIRHLPQLLKDKSIIYGSDYNEDTISWNTRNIFGINFIKNDLIPPLKFENNYFDVVYSISVFTHLSEKLFLPWIIELNRILKHGGILIFTLHGDAFKIKLKESEQTQFINGNAVNHYSDIEGHRSYSTFHPRMYVERSIQGFFKIEKILPGEIKNGIPQQDTWIIRKSN